MIPHFKNAPLKYKLIASFLLIITINGVAGFVGLKTIQDLGDLVNVTYDKALMSGTFAQAVKFDFSQHDLEIRSALIAADETKFDKHVFKSRKAYTTLKDDLIVVEERALSPKSSELISEIRLHLGELEKVSASVLSHKKQLLLEKAPIQESFELEKSWDVDKKKSVLYRKLTALYDEAAEVGYHFRLESEEQNSKNLKRTLWIVILCLVVSFTLSGIVSYMIIIPLFRLKSVCVRVGEGDYSVRSKIDSQDEFGTLSLSLNSMLDTIQDKTENISSLLSSLPFGLFYFDEQGVISKERSQSTDFIFPKFNDYKHLSDFFRDNSCSYKQTDEIIKAVFQGLLPFNSAVFLFPDLIKSDRFIQLSYKPKYGPDKKLEKVILLAEDITEKIKAQDESRVLTERVERVSRISSDIAGFKEFLIATRELFSSITAPHPEELVLKRDLHSLKGMLGIYSFKTCLSHIHALEEDFHDLSPEDFLTKANACYQNFENQSQDIIDLLALNQDSGLRYFDGHKIDLVKKIAKETNHAQLLGVLNGLDKFPIQKVLAKYSHYALSIAEKLEDKKVKIVFGPSDEVSYEEVQRIDLVLVHVLNNSIDHGIESRYERSDLNKDEVGEIRISCKRNQDDSLEFKISDDGKGINGEFLLQKALRMGIIQNSQLSSITESEKVNLIFASGLSSKNEASEVSGRGIGLDAVKQYLESLGGSIELMTQLGVGTTFSFKVPALNIEPFNEAA